MSKPDFGRNRIVQGSRIMEGQNKYSVLIQKVKLNELVTLSKCFTFIIKVN